MPDPSLREFQQWMRRRIRPAGPLPAEGAPLNPQRGVPGEARMAVYAGGYAVRMREALAEVFEAVAHVLGEGAFSELARAYAARYPSHDYNLSLAGRHLPAFLAQWPRTRELPFLPDLAQLEWLICRAFHAFDAPPVDPARLAALPAETWECLRLAFQPSVGLIASAWPVLDVWQARTTPRESIRINLVGRPQRVLVYRQGVKVLCEPLEAPQHALLQALQQGHPLGEACAALAEGSAAADAPPPLTAWCARWTSLGLITGCTIQSA